MFALRPYVVPSYAGSSEGVREMQITVLESAETGTEAKSEEINSGGRARCVTTERDLTINP